MVSVNGESEGVSGVGALRGGLAMATILAVAAVAGLGPDVAIGWLVAENKIWLAIEHLSWLAAISAIALIGFGIPQLRLIQMQLEQLTLQPVLTVGVCSWNAEVLNTSLVVVPLPQPPGKVLFRVVTRNSGQRTAHHVRWEFRLHPGMAWRLDSSVEDNPSKYEFAPDDSYSTVEIDRREQIHPSEQQLHRINADVPIGVDCFEVGVIVSMDDKPLSDHRFLIQVSRERTHLEGGAAATT